jgi:hypothetical protein
MDKTAPLALGALLTAIGLQSAAPLSASSSAALRVRLHCRDAGKLHVFLVDEASFSQRERFVRREVKNIAPGGGEEIVELIFEGLPEGA